MSFLLLGASREVHTTPSKVRPDDSRVYHRNRIWRILPRHGLGWSVDFYHRSFNGRHRYVSLENSEKLIERSLPWLLLHSQLLESLSTGSRADGVTLGGHNAHPTETLTSICQRPNILPPEIPPP